VILSNRSVWPLRGLAVAVAAALTPAIAACEAGTNAPTQQWHQPTTGASTVVDNTLRINNVFVLGAPPAFRLTPGRSAGLFLALANNGAPDRLISIAAPGTAASVQLPAGGVGLGAQQAVLLTGPAPQVVLRNLTRSLNGGQFIRIVLIFQNAGAVALKVPVIPRSQYFSTFSPVPVIASASPSPSGSPSHNKRGQQPSPGPTVTATPSASPTA
jgi:copper(I)-binding protein